MAVKTPIDFNNALVSRDGKASAYFQRWLTRFFAELTGIDGFDEAIRRSLAYAESEHIVESDPLASLLLDYPVPMAAIDPLAAMSLLPPERLIPTRVIQDSRVNRGNYAPSAFPEAFYFTTDVNLRLLYCSDGISWNYVAGIYTIAQAGVAAFVGTLTAADAGQLIYVSDYEHLMKWDGSALDFAPGDDGSGYIGIFRTTPNHGIWQVCDGSSVNVLNADGTVTSITSPNYSTASYLKLATAAAIGPDAASGTVANESAHTHQVDPPNTTSSIPSSTVEVQAGTGEDVATETHSHDVNVTAFASGAGSAHNHAPGTLELQRTELIAYMRR